VARRRGQKKYPENEDTYLNPTSRPIEMRDESVGESSSAETTVALYYYQFHPFFFSDPQSLSFIFGCVVAL
jgi:hypothetical protein